MPAPDRKRRLSTFAVALAVLIAAPLAVVASDAFDDVDNSNVHHDDITWLADNGVTAGCNPPDNTEFCPGDPVLRQQMASFMRRLAENQVVDAATAQTAETAETASDADMLDGQDGTAYSTVVAAANCGINDTATATSCGPNSDGTLPDQTTIEMLELEIEVPAPGTLAIDVHSAGNTANWVTLNDECATYVSGDFGAIYSQLVNGLLFGGEGIGSGSTATSVDAGTHTIRFCSAYESTDGGGLFQIGNLVTTWTPGGSVDLQSDAPEGDTELNMPLLGS